MAKLNRFLGQARYVPQTFALVWTAAKGWTTTWFVLLVIQSLIPVFSVLLTREFVNGIVDAVETGWSSADLRKVLLPFSLLVFLLFLERILNSIASWVRIGQSEVVRDYISETVQAQATRLDMSYYEQNEYYDLIHRVREQARSRPLMLLENLGLLGRSLLSIIGLGAVLVSYGFWLMPVLVLSALPALWSVMSFNRRLNRWRKSVTFRERLSQYYDLLLTERISAYEIRLFSLGHHYRQVFQNVRRELRNERLQLWRSRIIVDLFVTMLGIGVAAGVMVWMGWRVVMGTAALGDLAALYQIFTSVQAALSTITARAGDVYESVLFLEDLFVFLGLEPRLTEPATGFLTPLKSELRFEEVSFRYPGSERDAISNFSGILPAQKIIALVGENGEGKTTLMKLLCRFHDPDSGRILWDGTDLRNVPLHALHRQISMLFQAPYYYPETAYNNIAVGDIEKQITGESIRDAAKAAAAHDIIIRLPKGYETVLGKWFGGEDLSIGQWQRLALARAFVREASLVILDEPTSAMDAWAETEWLKNVREIARDRTLIMITHRFTTAMHADHILVLQNQKIVEQGTHSDLLKQGGRYASSWHEQMRATVNTDADKKPA